MWFCAKASWNDCWADVVVGIPFKFDGKLSIWFVEIQGIWGFWGKPGNWAENPAADPVW